MTTTTDELQRTILGRLSGAPAGLAPRALLAGLPAPQAQVALGLLIVSGRVDEVDGRLSLTLLERRASVWSDSFGQLAATVAKERRRAGSSVPAKWPPAPRALATGAARPRRAAAHRRRGAWSAAARSCKSDPC